MAAIGIGMGLFVLRSATGSPLVESFVFAPGVMVALVPEGLPATLSVSLAIGVRRMARRAALIRSWLPWRRWDRGPTPPGLPAHPTCPAQAAPYSRKRLPQYGFQVSRIPAKAIQGCGAASLPSAPRNRSAGLAIPAPGAAGWCCTAAVRHRPRPARRAGQRTAPRRPAADHPRHGAAVPGRSQAPPQLAFPARIGAGRSRPACPALGTRAAPRLPTATARLTLPSSCRARNQGRSSALVADFLSLIRTQPGDDRCPRNRIQGIELRLDALNSQLGRLALPWYLYSCGGQRDSGRGPQRCPQGL